MSDVFKPTGSEDQSTGVPHHGNLPDSLQEGHPTYDFDNTALEKPFGARVLTPLYSPTTLPEHMPPVDEQETTPSAQESTKKSHLWLKIGATIAALAALGGSFIAGRGSGSNNPENKVIVETPSTESKQPSPPTTDLLNPDSELSKSVEAEGIREEGLSPVLMTATTYDGILKEFRQNLYCLYNSRYTSVQEQCLAYIDGEGGGELNNLLQERLANVNDYRISHPDYEATIEFSDPTPSDTTDNIQFFGDSQAIIVTKMTDPSGSSIKRFSFMLKPVNIQQLDTQDQKTTAWALFEEETLEDGMVSFE